MTSSSFSIPRQSCARRRVRWVFMLVVLGMVHVACIRGPRASAVAGQACDAHDQPEMILTGESQWVVPEAWWEDPALRAALDDVRRDWHTVFGCLPHIVHVRPTDACTRVVFGEGQLPPRPRTTSEEPATAERHTLRMGGMGNEAQELRVSGTGWRGSLFSIYAFSEQVLGVNPWHWWVDQSPPPNECIVIPAGWQYDSGVPCFRYRGWFINDEDLLTGFMPDRTGQCNMSAALMDRIFETLLRLGGNCIIPTSNSSPDEHVREWAARRGLILSDHHMNPLGLNVWRWPADLPFSYTRRPDLMEHAWRACLEAAQGREQIWAVGYRGKSDWAFWVNEPELTTAQGRADAIQRAVRRQSELIDARQPGALKIWNLYSEGATLYRAGLLREPTGVTRVWPDNGAGLIRDNGLAGPGDGVYYHVMMFNLMTNHFSELISPEWAFTELGRMVRAGATRYANINVGVIRPVPLSCDAVMRLLWNPDRWLAAPPRAAGAEFIRDWCRRTYFAAPQPNPADGSAETQLSAGQRELLDALSEVYQGYFDTPTIRRNLLGDHAPHTMIRRLLEQSEPLWSDAGATSATLAAQADGLITSAGLTVAHLTPLLERACALERRLPEDRRGFYHDHLLLQLITQERLWRALDETARAVELRAAGADGTRVEESTQYLQAALECFDAIHAGRRRAAQGKWEHFYTLDIYVPTDQTEELLTRALALSQGHRPPPLRERGNPLLEVYRYQESHQRNFPLFHHRPGVPFGELPATEP